MSTRFSLSRRTILTGGAGLLGLGAFSWALPGRVRAATHFEPTARRVVYLFMSGAPSQLETFDPKPGLHERDREELPASVRNGQLLTSMTSDQGSFPVVAPRVGFAPGPNGAMVSDWLPHIRSISDRICIVRSMQTEPINHDPAILMMQTGAGISGRPALGAWLSYALGASSEDVPAYAVLLSTEVRGPGQPLFSRYWGSGFLPAEHQGVRFSGGEEPVLYLDDAARATEDARRRLRERTNRLDELHHAATGDPDVLARIEARELAGAMQTSIPRLLTEPTDDEVTRYGEAVRRPGTFAANCVVAKRLLAGGVTCVQLFHRDWDHHFSMQTDHPALAASVDQASAALVTDLRESGMLDDTLVVWGGEFGRTVYAQGIATTSQYGRDHHPRCFSLWMAGGGIREGYVHGLTDEYSYNVLDGRVHVHDLHATILHVLGFDHERLTFRAEGRDFRLTDVAGRVATELLA